MYVRQINARENGNNGNENRRLWQASWRFGVGKRRKEKLVYKTKLRVVKINHRRDRFDIFNRNGKRRLSNLQNNYWLFRWRKPMISQNWKIRTIKAIFVLYAFFATHAFMAINNHCIPPKIIAVSLTPQKIFAIPLNELSEVSI